MESNKNCAAPWFVRPQYPSALHSLCIAGKQEVVKSLLRLLAYIQQHAYAGQHHEQA
jgi:hypothetical protein